eukprot:COSAG01_NODE_2609_length_7389_cov_19.579467_5_plen_55_part_00
MGVTTVLDRAEWLSGEMKKKRLAVELAYETAVQGLHSRGDRAELHGLDGDVMPD